MNKTVKNKVTICIVNYKTEELTRLCLRSIRKFTKYPHEVIVVDNNSGDKSLDYLRTVPWIKLIERPDFYTSSGSTAQGTALDIGLENCNTEFFLAMHTDTIVHKNGWLEWLVSQVNSSEKMACAGSGKLDLKPKWEVLLKQATDVKAWIKSKNIDNPRKLKFYIRAICAIYKTDILKEEKLSFTMSVNEGMTCAKQLYFELLDRGYETNAISEFKMAEIIYHLAHATMVINPEFEIKNKTEKKCKAKMEKLFNSPMIQNVLSDDSLDQ